MGPRPKSRYYYTEEELKTIQEKWLKDRNRIDADLAYSYYVDRYQEYEKYFANRNLRLLFHHASYLYRYIEEGEFLYLYEGEKEKISTAFWRLINHGYYSQFKSEEKKIRTRLGNIVKRQTYRKYKVRW